MKINSYARITLALDIIKKLSDGYHELETIKSRINLFDEITVDESNKTIVSCDKVDDTIVLKTITALQQKYHINKHVKVTIKKNIPVCGGLAGGSSNAGYILLALNKIWNSNIPREELVLFAREIGRDIPFFFYDGLVFDKEVDNDIHEIGVAPTFYVIIVNDGTQVSTKDAYSWLDYEKIGKVKASQKILHLKDKKEILKCMHNDFEQFVFAKYPNLQKIKKELQGYGLYALMSGSGSTIFGLSFDKKIIDNIYRKINYKYQTVIQTTTTIN
jgi:4-diphosphocytidyl-2-C-methyl-D-erythritol kinase